MPRMGFLPSINCNVEKSPRITIGMTTYNAESFVEKSISSLLSQDYGNFELIISDNGSTDDTPSICTRLLKSDDRIVFFRNNTNINPLANASKILDICSGSYFMWAADHDIYENSFISSLLNEFLIAPPETALIYPGHNFIDTADRTIQSCKPYIDTANLSICDKFKTLLYKLSYASMFYGLYKTEVLKKCWKIRHVIGPDHVLLANISLYGDIRPVDKQLIFLRNNRVSENPNDVVKRQLEWFCKDPHEKLIPWTLHAFEHVKMINETDIDESLKNHLIGEVKNCFQSKIFHGLVFYELMKKESETLIQSFKNEMISLQNHHHLRDTICNKYEYLSMICDFFRNSKAMPIRIVFEKLNSNTVPTVKNKYNSLESGDKSPKIAGYNSGNKDLTQIQEGSQFEYNLRRLIAKIRPKYVIETGTYIGEGTTRIIASSIRDENLYGTKFYSIECNPKFNAIARKNLSRRNLLQYVELILGLSVPREMLPTVENIKESTVDNLEMEDIYVDHIEKDRPRLYFQETNFPDHDDNCLGACLKKVNYSPDIIVLDSGGHIGHIEFTYLIEHVKNECYVVLDDIKHIKHYKSYNHIKTDPRFDIIVSSDEKFGFCIAKFSPYLSNKIQLGKKILWVRPDAIGDAVLSARILSTIKMSSPELTIDVLCNRPLVPYYSSNPSVNKVISFDKRRAYNDSNYREKLATKLKKNGYHTALHSVWSREPIGDFLTISSEAVNRIGHSGDICNITMECKREFDSYYTHMINSPSNYKLELHRNLDFLHGIGLDDIEFGPDINITMEDEEFADHFFKKHNFKSIRTIALFSGTLNEIRRYSKFGQALESLCDAYHLSVVAMGSAQDQSINQANLDQLNCPTLNASGKTTIGQAAAILKRCRLAVGAETGLAHIACAVGTPNIVLLGGGHFGRFMPYSPLTTVVSLPLDCFACNWRCKYSQPHCIRDLDPIVLRTATKETLDRQSYDIRLYLQSQELWQKGAGIPKWHLPKNLILDERAELFIVDETGDAEALDIVEGALPPSTAPSIESIPVDGVEEQRKLEDIYSLVRSQQMEEAYSALQSLVQNHPDFAQAHNDLGVMSIQTSNSEKALFHYRRAVEIEPDNATFQKNLADYLYIIAKDRQTALQIYLSLLKFNPEDTEVLYAIGCISKDLGQLNDAETFFRRILEIDHSHENAHKMLGLCQKTPAIVTTAVTKKKASPGLQAAEDANATYSSALVSAIVSVYNAEGFIAGCLENLQSQTISDRLEIIVVDSGSQQNEASIVREFQKNYPNIRYIRTEERETVYAAWNRGIKSARGRYITNANCDDRHKPDAFEIMSRTLDQRPDVALVYADCLITKTENETFSNCTPIGKFQWLDWDRKALLNRGCFMGPQPMWRRSVHEEYGYFDPELVTSGDYEFWLRISQTHDFHHIPQSLGLYLRSPQSIEHRNRETQAIENKKILKLYRKAAEQGRIIGRLIDSDKNSLPSVSDDNSAILENCVSSFEKGRYDEAQNHLCRILATHPNHWEAYRLLVDVLLQSGQEAAIPEQLRALEDRSDLPPHMLALIGSGYEATGDLTKAADYADQSISADPECGQAWNLRGVLAFRNGDMDQAAAIFQRVIEKNGDWGEPWTNLGTVYWEQGDHIKALEYLEKGFSLSPTAPNVGTAYHASVSETGQYERAKPLFEDIVDRHPDFRKARYLLIDILIRLEAYADALTQIESLLVHCGPEPQLLEAAKTVRSKVGPVTIKKGEHPSLSLCMIVKNEEKYLPKCLENLKPLVDEMIVVDTGSTDATRDIAEIFGAKVSDFEWNDDFAAARNHSLDQASGDWILVMDADEVIAPKDHQKLMDLLIQAGSETLSAYLMTTRNYTDRYDDVDFVKNSGEYDIETSTGWIPSKKVRLFNNRQGVHFVYPVHELVDPVLTELGIPQVELPVPVHHFGKLDLARTSDRWQMYYDLGKKKLESDAQNDQALKELAIQAGLLSKWNEAEKHWETYLDHNPKSVDACMNLTRIMANQGKFEQANHYAQKAFDLSENRTEPIYNLALSELQTGQAVKAAKTAAHLVNMFSDDQDGIILHALAEICAGNLDAGSKQIEALSQTVSQETIAPRVLSIIASIKSAGFDEWVSTIVAELSRVFDLNTFSQPTTTEPGKNPDSDRQNATLSDEDPLVLFDKARKSYETEDYQTAFDLLSCVVAAESDHWEAYRLLVDVMLQSGQEGAIPSQLRSLESRSDLPAEVTVLIGSGYEAAGELDQADQLANQALTKDANCARAWNLKGVLAYHNGHLEEAASHLQLAGKNDREWGEPWTNLGSIHWEQGDREHALDCFEKGFRLSPTAPNVATTYHIAISETGQHERARGLFEKVVANHPDFKKARFLLIDILIRLEDYSNAIAHIESLVVHFGPDPQLLKSAKAVRAKKGPMSNEKGNRPSLSLCMIVKNEETNLPRCLESLKPLVDEMIVVDTGSEDATRDIAEVFGAKVFDFEWNDDFAAARNHSLEQAGGDWILVMDADEVIAAEDHSNIRKLLNQPKSNRRALQIVTRNYTEMYNTIGWEPNQGQYPLEEAGSGWVPSEKVRIFPNDKAIRFEYPVHEVVGPSLSRKGIPVEGCPYPVHHYGKLDRHRELQKAEHYFKLGVKKLFDSQDDPVAIRELAIQAAKLGKREDSVILWKRLLELSPNNATIYINLASNYCKLKKYLDARKAARKAVKLAPEMREGHLNLGLSELHLGHFKQAENIFRKISVQYPGQYSAIFLLGASQLCQRKIKIGTRTLQSLKTKPIWANLSYAIQDLIETLRSAGWPQPARNLIIGAKAIDCSNDKIEEYRRELEMIAA